MEFTTKASESLFRNLEQANDDRTRAILLNQAVSIYSDQLCCSPQNCLLAMGYFTSPEYRVWCVYAFCHGGPDSHWTTQMVVDHPVLQEMVKKLGPCKWQAAMACYLVYRAFYSVMDSRRLVELLGVVQNTRQRLAIVSFFHNNLHHQVAMDEMQQNPNLFDKVARAVSADASSHHMVRAAIDNYETMARPLMMLPWANEGELAEMSRPCRRS